MGAYEAYAKITFICMQQFWSYVNLSFEIAVEDDIIRKNPAKKALGDYGEPEKKRTALTLDQQRKLLAFVRDHENFAVYLPMLQIMIGTELRCGGLVGFSWKDVDMKKRTVSMDHQLAYKNYWDGYNFRKTLPKTQAGGQGYSYE